MGRGKAGGRSVQGRGEVPAQTPESTSKREGTRAKNGRAPHPRGSFGKTDPHTKHADPFSKTEPADILALHALVGCARRS